MHSPIARRRAEPTTKEPESIWSSVRFLLLLALVAWAIRSFVVAPFSIPSGSMLPTLFVGDYLVVAKWPYGYSRFSLMFGFPPFSGRIMSDLPDRGDVVVFRHPSDDLDLIKRVVALPGDVVEVRQGQLVLNGKPVQRRAVAPFRMPLSPNSACRAVPPSSPQVLRTPEGEACVYRAFVESLPGGPSYQVLDQVRDGAADDRAPMRIPEGHVFLLGDNRDDSFDSRYSPAAGGIGLVPTDRLIGRALVTFWSTDGSASYFKPWTWFTALRTNRIGNGYSQ